MGNEEKPTPSKPGVQKTPRRICRLVASFSGAEKMDWAVVSCLPAPADHNSSENRSLPCSLTHDDPLASKACSHICSRFAHAMRPTKQLAFGCQTNCRPSTVNPTVGQPFKNPRSPFKAATAQSAMLPSELNKCREPSTQAMSYCNLQYPFVNSSLAPSSLSRSLQKKKTMSDFLPLT